VALSSFLRDRLRDLGIDEQLMPAFLEWCRNAGYLGPLENYSQGDLAGRLNEYQTTLSRRAGRHVPLRRAAAPRARASRNGYGCPDCTSTRLCWTCEGVARWGGAPS